jgi:NTE family protein
VPTDPSTAFVLAGGGTKGAFEAGAVAYLVEELGIVPGVVTATSAGSICAAVLAQARTHEELSARTDELRHDLLAMTHTELLFGRQPWLAALDGTLLGRAIVEHLTTRTRPPVPGDGMGTIVGGLPTRSSRHQRLGRLALAAAEALPRLPAVAHRARRGGASSFLNLDPIEAALRHGGPSGIRPVDGSLIARPGLLLRLAVTALGAGVLRYVTEDGTIVEADAVTPVAGAGAGPVDVLDGALASASVPAIFPPRPMAGDVYVDGGVVNNVPVQAAANLGATRIVAVLAVPLVQPPDRRDFTKMSGAGIFLRSVGAVSFADRQLANLNPPLPPGVDLAVIDPRVDVVGPFEVAHGLMLLDMDYGWLRAADVTADVGHDTRRRAAAASDAVVTARTQSWHLEEALWRAGRVRQGDLARLGRLKAAVRDAVDERKGLGLPTPTEATRWWSGYEEHLGRRPAGLPDDPSPPR